MVQVIGSDDFARALAQAGHPVLGKIVNPSGDDTFRNPRRGSGIGDGPPVDKHALNDLAALCGG